MRLESDFPADLNMARGSFFDRRLPLELVRIIMQSLSERPAHFYAESYTDAAVVCAFSHSSESARCVSRELFSGISTGLESENCEGCPFDPATRDPGLLLKDSDSHLLEPLLIQLGSAVQSLTIDALLVSGVGWLDAMVHHAKNVRDLWLHSIDYDFSLTDVLRATPNLQSLTISSSGILHSNHIFTLTHEATQLQSLSLSQIHSDNRLHSIWNSFPHLRKIGLSFTSMPKITAGDFPDDDIFKGIASGSSPVEINTLNLGELQLNGLRSLAQLCARVGKHLKSLSFSLHQIRVNHMEEQLSLIKQNCLDVTIRLTCYPDHLVPAMEVLGDGLEAIQPTRSIFVVTPAGLEHAASCASKLKSITLTLCDRFAAEFLDKLLRPIGKHLHELRLTIYPEYEMTEHVPTNCDIIDSVAKYCSELRRIVLDRIRPNTSLKKIAANNKELLALVAIVDSNIDTSNLASVEEWMAKIVHDFLTGCPNIVDITIEENDQGTISPNRIQAVDDVTTEFWGYNSRNRDSDSRADKKKIGVQVGQLYYEK